MHPAQVLFSDGDFIGLGTANGVGVDNCPNHYDGDSWQVYVDGDWNGVYHCEDLGVTEPAGATPSFVMEPDFSQCGSSLKWSMIWRSNLEYCVNVGSSSAKILSWGGEQVTQTSPLNIDVEHRSIRRSLSGESSWVYIEPFFSSYAECFDSVYEVDYLGRSKWRIHEPPMGVID